VETWLILVKGQGEEPEEGAEKGLLVMWTGGLRGRDSSERVSTAVSKILGEEKNKRGGGGEVNRGSPTNNAGTPGRRDEVVRERKRSITSHSSRRPKMGSVLNSLLHIRATRSGREALGKKSLWGLHRVQEEILWVHLKVVAKRAKAGEKGKSTDYFTLRGESPFREL